MEFSKEEKVSEIRYKVHLKNYMKNGISFLECMFFVSHPEFY